MPGLAKLTDLGVIEAHDARWDKMSPGNAERGDEKQN